MNVEMDALPVDVELLTVDEVMRSMGWDTLIEGAPLEAVKVVLTRTAEASNDLAPIDAALVRESATAHLMRIGIRAPARLIGAAFDGSGGTSTQEDEDEASKFLEAPVPWPDPVDGRALFHEVVKQLERFLVLPVGSAPIMSLWVFFSHAHDAFPVSPILNMASPQMRCGKSTGMAVLSAIVPKPLTAVNVTPAVLFRVVDAFRPTLLCDEVDTFLKDNAEVHGIFNSGHLRSSAMTPRCVGDNHEVKLFGTFCPKVLAGIGRLPDTMTDRSVVVMLKRAAPGEIPERLRQDRWDDEARPLLRQLARWALDNLEALREADPVMPEHWTNARRLDNHRPLFAIADRLGADVKAQAIEAADAMVPDLAEEDTVDVQLLADIMDAFDTPGVPDRLDRIKSAALVDHLKTLEDRLWPGWNRGEGIKPQQVARRLKPFGIRPKHLRFTGGSARGYEREAFEDSWSRYVTPAQGVEPGVTPQQANGDSVTPVTNGVTSPVTQAVTLHASAPDVTPKRALLTGCVTPKNTTDTHAVTGVTGVTPMRDGSGELPDSSERVVRGLFERREAQA